MFKYGVILISALVVAGFGVLGGFRANAVTISCIPAALERGYFENLVLRLDCGDVKIDGAQPWLIDHRLIAEVAETKTPLLCRPSVFAGPFICEKAKTGHKLPEDPRLK